MRILNVQVLRENTVIFMRFQFTDSGLDWIWIIDDLIVGWAEASSQFLKIIIFGIFANQPDDEGKFIELSEC